MNTKTFFNFERKIYLQHKRNKLINTSPSILSSNCNGGVILHDLNLKFNTPTINLFFNAPDFIKFLSNLDYYLSENLLEIERKSSYPMGIIKDIQLHFMHYHSFTEARDKWIERRKRVNPNNLFIIMTDRDNCTEKEIYNFDNLNYANKVIFTHVPYPKYKSAYYIKGFESKNQVGILSDWKKTSLKRRYIDDFNYVDFLNKKTKFNIY